jgi:transcriptional regulator with XRE-family HTH domain
VDSIGDRIKALRGQSLTQQQLADAAQVSVAVIRKLEQNQRHTAALPTLHALAAALGTDLPDLLGRPRSTSTATAPSALAAIRDALTSVDDLLADLDDVGLPDLTDVRRSTVYAWGAFSSGRYDLLGEVLPRLLAETRAIVHAAPAGEAGEAADLAAQAAQIAIGTLMQFGANDLAYATARQAIRDATAGFDPLREIALRHSLSHVLMRQGRQDDARRLMVAAAQSIRSGGATTPVEEAVRGALLLRAAGAASRARDHAGALALVGEARELANTLGPGPVTYPRDYAMAFGAAQVAVISTDVQAVAQDFDQALVAARTMPGRGAALPLMSRTRHLADLAYAHAQLGNDDRATDAVLALAGMAPHLLPHQRLAWAVTQDLMTRQPRPQLRELAKQWNPGAA